MQNEPIWTVASDQNFCIGIIMQMKYFMLIEQKFQYMTHFKNTDII